MFMASDGSGVHVWHACLFDTHTGAGKTHTMGTAAAPSSLPSPTSGGGVVPAACAYVLRHAAAAGATYQVALKVWQRGCAAWP